ncbi:MAG: hypothetical protein C4306_10375 [Thermoleophilia bacterium]
MTLATCWALFPLLLGLLAGGCGLLVERVSGLRLPGPLLLPLGLALVIVAATFATHLATTAPLALPVVVALAVAGYGLGLPRHGTRLDGWAIAAPVAAYACYAAPIVLAGQATFAGYITLDDTATWLALADRVMEDGRSLSGLAPSTYELVLRDYLADGYPVGSFLPMGLGGKLTGQDLAWLFQPAVALFAAMLALSLYGALPRLVRSRPLRALVAAVAAQPALLFAYAFWSGIKELAAAFLLALLAAVVPVTIDSWSRPRATVPAALAAAGLLAALGAAGAAWLVVPGVLVASWLAIRDARALPRAGIALVVSTAFLSLPSLVLAPDLLASAAGGEVTDAEEVANLGHPLDSRQIFGIWPAPDFRSPPDHPGITNVLIVLSGLALVAGVLLCVRRRAWAVPLYLGIGGLGALLIMGLQHVGLSSPWLNAKAMASGSPALVAAGLAGSAAIFELGRRTEGSVILALVAGGVLWSNALTYSGVWLAPRDQLAELERIGEQFAGQGPTLTTETSSFGPRHFLRRMDPEHPSGRRRRPVYLVTGGTLDKGEYADIDRFALDSLFVYRTLVLRRSPLASRPPSVFRLVWQGRFWEVWQQRGDAPRILEHVPLGGETDPAALPPCSQVERLARRVREARGTLAVAARSRPVVLDLSRAKLPPGWAAGSGGTVVPAESGAIELQTRVPAGGRYVVWLGGSFRRRVQVWVDGRRVGSAAGELTWNGYVRLGSMRLGPGRHRIEVRYGGSVLLPGRGRSPFPMGPLVLSTSTAAVPVELVEPDRARSLCGQRLDWVEAVVG